MRSEGAGRGTRLVLPLLVLVALVAGFLGGRALPPVVNDATPAANDDATHVDAAALARPDAATLATPGRSTASPAGMAPAVAPLPPLDAPLRDILPALEQRAREGDSAAACRMALDVELCRQQPQFQHAIPFFEEAAARAEATSDDDVDFIARIEAIHRRAEQVCAGLDAAWIEDRGWRYMLQAAQRDPRLAARYATAPPLDAGRFLEQSEAWQAYAAHAAHLLRWAAEQGDPRAWYALQQAYTGRPTLRGMPNAIPADPARAAMMALVLREFSDASTRRDLDDGLAALRESLGPERWAAVESEAAAQRQRHFATQPAIDFAGGVYGDQDARICEEPATR